MCVSARIARAGRPVVHVTGFGELRRLLGWRPPSTAPAWPHADRECLCHIDWPKLCRLSSFRVVETPQDDESWRVWLTNEKENKPQ